MEDATRLMARVRVRDAAALETLYDQYHRLVYGIAMRVLGDAAGAEDVTQAVFLKMWSAPETFRGGNFPGWLVRVSRNRALDAVRRRSRSEAELGEDLPEEDFTDNAALSALDAALVRDAVSALPPEQREPIEMGFFEGLTHEQIAARSGVPLGTIKTRIRAGLRRLRSSLDEAVSA